MRRYGRSVGKMAALLLVAVLAAVGLAGTTLAQAADSADAMRLFRDDCKLIDALDKAQQAEIKAKPEAEIVRIQNGVRAVYSDAELQDRGVVAPRQNLTDGKFGPQTQAGLVVFCADFPVLTKNTEMARFDALFGSARHFATLAAIPVNQNRAARQARASWRDWRGKIAAPEPAAALRASPVLRLRLAGATGVVQQLLGQGPGLETGGASATVCGGAADLPAETVAPYRPVMTALLAAAGVTAVPEADGALAASVCERFRLAATAESAASDTEAALAHYAALQHDDPQALATIADPGFGGWVAQQGGGPVPYHRLLRLGGSEPVVLALLEEYRQSEGGQTGKPVTPPPAPVADGLPASCSPTRGGRYFELTAADVKAIAGREKLAAGVAKLAGAQANDLDAAVALIAEAVPGLDRCNRDYVRQVIDSKANRATAFELVDNGFANGALFTLPPAARTELQALAKLPPPADKAVLTGQINQILAQALQQKAAADAARYAAQAAARAKPVAPQASSPGPGAAPSAAAAKTGGESETSPDASATTTDTPATVTPATDSPAPTAASAPAAPAAPAFELPKGIADALKADGMPAEAADAVSPLAGQPFPALDALAQSAAQAITVALSRQNAQQLQTFEAAVAAQIRKSTVIAFEDKAMTALQAMPALRAIDPAVLAWVEPLQGVAFPDHMLFARATDNPLNLETAAPAGLAAAQANLTLAARKTPAPAEGADPLRMTVAGDCGCVPWDLKADRDVYGFYPLWIAEGGAEPPPPPAVDLSLFSRVAFFGARAAPGEDGYAIADWSGWQPDGGADGGADGTGVAGFVEAVHRHNAKADLAVTLDQWQTLDPQSNAAAAVAKAVAERTLPPPGFWSAAWHMITSQGAVNGFLEAPLDGVTLYFPDMADVVLAEGPVATAGRVLAMAQIFRAQLPKRVVLNIAFAMPIGADEDMSAPKTVGAIRSRLTLLYMALAPALQGEGDEAAPVDLVLVLLNRPTTEAKKLLVRGIQDGFSGEVRRIMLRKTIAVLPPNGHRQIDNRVPELVDGQRQSVPQNEPFGQFDDDLSFFRDNLRGAGFWRLPLASDDGYDEVVERVRERFWTADDSLDRVGVASSASMVGAMLAPFVQTAEALLATARQFVCTHRVAIRLFAGFLLAGLVVLAVLSYFHCAVCMGIARKLYIAPIGSLLLAVVWAGLALFDPLFAPFAVLWLLALLPMALLYNLAFGYIFRMQRADDP